MLTDSNALAVIGPSGSGKSHLLESVLRYYGSGIVCLALGDDEKNSYYPHYKDAEHYDFNAFDDPDFQVTLGQRNAHGLNDAIKWLEEMYLKLKAEVAAGKPLSRKVLVIDTGTALGQLAMNQTLKEYGLNAPPPVRGEKGFPFFSYLGKAQAGLFARMRAIRGLGVHWVMSAQAAEREVTEGQASVNVGQLKKMTMPNFPGGFRDVVPQYFDLVVQSQVIPATAKQPKHHILLSVSDPQRVTKVRWGDLPANLPNEWTAILPKLEEIARFKEEAMRASRQ